MEVINVAMSDVAGCNYLGVIDVVVIDLGVIDVAVMTWQ